MTEIWDKEKWLLEQNAAEYFVAALNLQLKTSYQVILHSDRPDIVIKDSSNGHVLGVEVAHLFYDAEEARIFLGRSDADHSLLEDIRVIIERLNKLLLQKTEKAQGYTDPGELALLIRVMSPVFGVDDFTSHENLINVPPCKYKHIWLLFFNWSSKKWDLIKSIK